MTLDDPSEAHKEEFTFEIEQMKLLGSHKNVVSMVGCCTLENEMFLVIEYVPCGDLLTWLRRRRKKVKKGIKLITTCFRVPKGYPQSFFMTIQRSARLRVFNDVIKIQTKEVIDSSEFLLY